MERRDDAAGIADAQGHQRPQHRRLVDRLAAPEQPTPQRAGHHREHDVVDVRLLARVHAPQVGEIGTDGR